MSDTTGEGGQDLKRTRGGTIARKIDAGGWGLFFIWVGVCALLNPGWGVVLLGIGIITLGGQAMRKYFDLKLDGFWIFVGLLFLLGGALELLQVKFSIIPVVLIIAGLALLVSIIKKKHTTEG